ncbi:glucose-1-phosphate thymidylyltransferase [Flavobacteriaceae bacterium UJ101]|nr:glucose-1-phosphate thymidylyltransferase [Flavobacteriaceae bacterium UJ101]
MKGIILAGGSGTRLYPLTIAISKQLIPVYDKPMVYYPLSTLMLAGIREILIISTPHDIEGFKRLLGDGSQIGCKFEYKVQEVPNGLAQAFILGEEFIGDDSVALVLGDNIFYGSRMHELLTNVAKSEDPTIFAYRVSDPERYGVVGFEKVGDKFNVTSLEEKPENPKSNFAVPGLYFYDNSVVEIAKNIEPSARGEYEITDVNKEYLKQGKLKVAFLDRGTAWLDTGTIDSLHDAAEFVKVLEKRQGFKISCIEEIAFRKAYINKEQLLQSAKKYGKSGYGSYLKSLIAQ